VISTQPSASAQSGVAFAQQPVIHVRDVWNNAVLSPVVVTAAIASGGTLSGMFTATTNANGVASFANSDHGQRWASVAIFTAASLTASTSARSQ
jgi:hypothetical protein